MSIKKTLLSFCRVFDIRKTSIDGKPIADNCDKKTVADGVSENTPKKPFVTGQLGWKFKLSYKSADNSGFTNIYTMQSGPTDNIVDNNKNRDHFRSIIANVHDQLDSNSGDYINVDNTLIIKKQQFISAVVVVVDPPQQ